jgi:hypothetical protein
MPVAIEIKSNVKTLISSLSRKQRTQVPYALAGALTATAFDAQRAVKSNLEKKFTLRNRFTTKGIRVRKATKHNLSARIFATPQTARYLEGHEYGETRTPQGRSIAVPMSVRKSKQQKITKAKRPRTVLDKPNTFRIVGDSRLPDGIYQRMRGKAKRLKMLYALEPSIRIKRRFGMEKTVRGVAKNKIRRNMQKSLSRALSSAR